MSMGMAEAKDTSANVEQPLIGVARRQLQASEVLVILKELLELVCESIDREEGAHAHAFTWACVTCEQQEQA